MDIQSIILILISLANAILAYIVFTNNKKSNINRSFSLFGVGVTIWAFTNAATRLSATLLAAWVWSVISYMSAVLIGLAFFYFSLVFPANFNTLKKYHKLLIYLSFPIILIILAIPGLTVKNIILQPWKIITGPGLPIFAIYFLTFMVWAFVNLIKKYQRTKGISRVQIKYIFVGILLSAILGVGCNLILPLFGDYRFVWLGPIFAIFVVGFTTYAITRYQLMDIRLVVKRSTVYLTSVALAITTSMLLWLAMDKYLNLSFTTTGLIALLISTVIIQPIRWALQSLANKYFFASLYSQHLTLKKLSERLTTIIDLQKLIDTITNVIQRTLGLDKIALLLREPESNAYKLYKTIGFREENGLSLVRDNLLTEHLQKTGKPLAYEELTMRSLGSIKENMKGIQAHLCLPLMSKAKLQGIIVLGKKVSGEAFSREDMELLEALSNQTSIAIENARLYDQIKDLSENLEKKVQEQTESIKALSEMKTEFLKVVNHQLRTPASIIKGMLSMLAEGSVQGEKLKDYINKSYLSSERLVTILDDVLNAQELVGGELAINLVPCQLGEIIERVVEHFQFFAEQKNLTLTFEKPGQPLPQILLDPERIERTLNKLIDNAILYTERGGITITLETIKENHRDYLQIKAKDTGIGITQKDKEGLFKLFSRGEEGIKLHPNGSGLGLYIAKEYVKAHQGKIEVQSQGRNKGTTFIITLPIITEV